MMRTMLSILGSTVIEWTKHFMVPNPHTRHLIEQQLLVALDPIVLKSRTANHVGSVNALLFPP